MFDLISTVIRENAQAGVLPAYIAEMAVTPDMTLSDLGVDSLGRLTVLSEIYGKLGVPQVDLDMDDDVSLREIAEKLSAMVAQLAHPASSPELEQTA